MTNARLPLPALMLVTDRRLAGGEDALVAKVGEAVNGGVDIVQLREKDLGDDELLPLARKVKNAIAGRALLFVNGSGRVAREIGADGVHLPAYAPPLEGNRGGMLVGRSVHSVASARRALRQGVDYLLAGAVYETSSHEGREPAGLQLIADLLAVASVPVLAIGGITPERLPHVIDAGASGVAVISAILGADSPRDAAAEMIDALDRSWLRDRGALA